MDFLPIMHSGQRVYSGFGKRFCAMWIDAFIVMPISFFFMWLQGIDKTLAIVILIPSTALFSMYHVYFNACYGGSLGKLAVGIRVTRPDGSKIGWSEALMRSAVIMVFSFVIVCVQVWALTRVSSEDYSKASGIFERMRVLQPLRPSWFPVVRSLQQVWIWGELIALLSNKRRRALHDFIAGTVVIRKEFADISIIPAPAYSASDGDWVSASRGYLRGASDH